MAGRFPKNKNKLRQVTQVRAATAYLDRYHLGKTHNERVAALLGPVSSRLAVDPSGVAGRAVAVSGLGRIRGIVIEG